MKLTTTILPFVTLTAAFVVPDEQLTKQLVQESKGLPSFLEKVQDNVKHIWSGAESKINTAVKFSENALDSAIDAATGVGKKAAASFQCYESMMRFETQEWLDSAVSTFDDLDVLGGGDGHPPHHGPPHHGPPHHKPHHPHHKPNKTVYELIASSKYTTKLAKLISEYPDLVKALNGTAANYTVFAPTDKAFEKIPGHHKPSKEIIEKVLQYHVSADFYPAGRIFVTHTIPTIYKEKELGGEPQRLRVGLGFKGLAVNFYSRVVAANIFGTNGVIHGVDSILLPPPEALKIIELLPGEFSTLQLGLVKTNLSAAIAKSHHEGGTLFAPSNFAFKKLGPKINAFLFSKYGEKYLKALLEYHIVANQTLYSDAFYKSTTEEAQDIPKGHFHYDLPTLLKDKSLSIDIGRYGGFISIKINGFSSVAIQDGIAKDGVIQVVSNVLIPPKSPGGDAEEAGEMDIEDFKQRLLPDVYPQEL